MSKQRATLALIIIIAAALRLFHLESTSLSYDEVGQVLVSRPSWWSAVAGAASHAGAAPLDYLITHAMLKIGNSDGILRLPAVFFGVASVALLYLLARWLFGDTPALLAAIMLALTPMHIAYSQTLRFYSLATFMALATALVFWQAQKHNRWPWWITFGATLTIGLYAHYYLAFVALAMGLWCLFFRREALLSFAVAATVAALLFAPYAYYDNVLVGGSVTLDSTTLRVIGGLPKVLVGPFVPVNVSAYDISYVPLSIWILVGALWGLALLGLFWLPFSRRRESLALPLLIVAVGVPGLLLLDYMGQYNFLGRQTLIFAPFLILGAVGTFFDVFSWPRVSQRPEMPLAAAMAMIAALVLYPSIANGYAASPGDLRAMTQFLYRNVGPDDVIVVGYRDHLSYYAPDMRPSTATVNLKRLDKDIAHLAAKYKTVWIVPWMPTWEPALSNWSEAHGAWNVSPLDGAVYVYSHDAMAGAQLTTELLDSNRLNSAQKATLLTNAALTLWQEGKKEELVAMLEPYADSKYATPTLWRTLGKIYMAKRNKANLLKAKDVFARLVKAQPNDWEANYILSVIAMREEDWPQARLYAETAVRNHPTAYGEMAISKNLIAIYAQTGETILMCNVWQSANTGAPANADLARMVKGMQGSTVQVDCD